MGTSRIREPLPPGAGIGVSYEGVPVALKAPQGRPDRVSDVEADPGAAPLPLTVPAQITAHLIRGVEPPAGHQALGKTQGHGGIVGPLAGREAEGSAADHVVDRLKGAGPPELQGRPQGIAHGKSQEGPLITQQHLHPNPSGSIIATG